LLLYAMWLGSDDSRLKNQPSTHHSASSQSADVRSQLSKIDLHHATSIDDYIDRAMKVRSLVPQMVAFYDNSRGTISASKIKYQSQPQMLELTNFIEKLNERDEYGFQLLEDEIRFAYEMQSLPKMKRRRFFASHITPLMQAENSVVEEELKMANDGIKRGLPLPPDIVASLNSRRSSLVTIGDESQPRSVPLDELEKPKP
jgi:hypothetical protein